MYSKHDIAEYDRQLDLNRTRVAESLARHDAVYHHQQKARDERGLEIIAAGLNAIRNAGGGVEHVDTWAAAAWQLALQMFGGE